MKDHKGCHPEIRSVMDSSCGNLLKCCGLEDSSIRNSVVDNQHRLARPDQDSLHGHLDNRSRRRPIRPSKYYLKPHLNQQSTARPEIRYELLRNRQAGFSLGILWAHRMSSTIVESSTRAHSRNWPTMPFWAIIWIQTSSARSCQAFSVWLLCEAS